MTASQTAKAAGLKSLKELVRMSGRPGQTLINWYNNEPELFDLVIKGAVIRKKCDEVIRFNTADEPHVPIEVTPYGLAINNIMYTLDDFRAGKVALIEADSQRVRRAIARFYIFVGDL